MYVNALSRKLLKTDKGQRKVLVTSARKVVGTSARKVVGTVARKVLGTAARKVVVTSARNTLAYFRTSFVRPAKD